MSSWCLLFRDRIHDKYMRSHLHYHYWSLWCIVCFAMGVMASGSNKKEVIKPVIRLFLVRHGETLANRKGHVVGQSHSPLSDLGIGQAQALGRTSRIRDTAFWRMYASDLKRAEHTAHLIINSAGKSPETLVLDSRLRETSKGARQGFPKTMLEDEAMEERRKRKDTGPVPMLETEDEGWSRAIDWLNDVVKDAALAARLESSLAPDQQQSTPPRYTVLAVAHAGIYRIFLRRLLGEDRLFAHPDASFDDTDSRFAIPNTSLTILDVTPRLQENGEAVPIDEAFEHIDIVQLTGTKHLQEVPVPEEKTTL